VPPYRKVTSKAQSRKLFALAREGKLSLADARGKTRAADFSKLPERKGAPTRAKRPKRTAARTSPRR
jgi:hypothetical protein